MFIRTPTDAGAVIRDRRTQQGLDQRALAKRAGVSLRWLVDMEAGKPNASLALVLRTLNALSVTLNADSQASPATRPLVDLDAIIKAAKTPQRRHKS
jgi:HTH-type transcriptional regulator / antitoxin HipB